MLQSESLMLLYSPKLTQSTPEQILTNIFYSMIVRCHNINFATQNSPWSTNPQKVFAPGVLKVFLFWIVQYISFCWQHMEQEHNIAYMYAFVNLNVSTADNTQFHAQILSVYMTYM